MTELGTVLTPDATKMLLLGSGELGKEVAIEAMRLGIEVIAVDRYKNAPAMQIAHRFHVINMLDGRELRNIIEMEKPTYVVPEIEALATPTLLELEAEGYTIIPTANAVNMTMNREMIRKLAAEELGIATSPYKFAGDKEEFLAAVSAIGLPCVVKPVMSSSGKGQTLIKRPEEVEAAWETAQRGGRAGEGRVIIEGFISFNYEITLLTVRHAGGTNFCEPIGHFQIDGDYRESWQPQPMTTKTLNTARQVALEVTNALGGRGIFGVELFIKGEEVIFSEISPRPHDTGLVTLISQDLSEFALHVRAILGLPIPRIRQFGPAASCAIVAEGHIDAPFYFGLNESLAAPDTKLFIFGKPNVEGKRRMGVTLALEQNISKARQKARAAAAAIKVSSKNAIF